jgi:hypothetical protein
VSKHDKRQALEVKYAPHKTTVDAFRSWPIFVMEYVQVGPPPYEASTEEVTAVVRQQLEEHWPLEVFSFPEATGGRRVKATMRFV